MLSPTLTPLLPLRHHRPSIPKDPTIRPPHPLHLLRSSLVKPRNPRSDSQITKPNGINRFQKLINVTQTDEATVLLSPTILTFLMAIHFFLLIFNHRIHDR
ncbi:hypothetical protein MtrunA17_Chr4g0006071 [Medicago truncatula]|uniref:Transmembrane protein n=1 Tax=Medicago truncatula TaxID=3880 RepID=A0A396I1Q6_MEDTR|nr:hypothetical protein MtrunA17_Chr4g0006071 [Medicago truncatula]